MKISYAVDSPEDSPTPEEYENNIVRIPAVLGYEAIEPLICDPKNINLAKFEKILRRKGLKLSGLRTGLAYLREGLSFSDPDKAVREKAVERIKEEIKFASHFPGATVLIGLMQGHLKSGVPFATAYNRIIECLRELVKTAEKKNVVLAIEPVNRYELNYNNTIDSIIQIIDRVASPYLRLLIDTFHMDIEEKSIPASILRAKDYIGAVHFADTNRLAPGYGHLDFLDIIRILRQAGYEGYLTIECYPKPDILSAAKKAIEHLKMLDQKLGNEDNITEGYP